jgi:preprotein translocase subunit YajC
MVDLAYAMGQIPGGAANGGGGIMSILPLMVGMFAIMYFIVIRPQQKQKRERDAMLGAIKKGDRVVTTSGIHGTVAGLDEHTVVLRVGDQVKLTFDRASVGRIIPADKESSP